MGYQNGYKRCVERLERNLAFKNLLKLILEGKKATTQKGNDNTTLRVCATSPGFALAYDPSKIGVRLCQPHQVVPGLWLELGTVLRSRRFPNYESLCSKLGGLEWPAAVY